MGKVLGIVAVLGILVGLSFYITAGAVVGVFVIGGSLLLLALACILDELVQVRKIVRVKITKIELTFLDEGLQNIIRKLDEIQSMLRGK